MTDEPDKAARPIKAAFILFALLLGACAKQPTTDERLAKIVPSSPTPASESTAAAQPRTITGKVVGVIDGDTIMVLDEQQRQHKVGLFGIDAPESNQDYGSRAKQSLSDLVFGRVVTVTSVAKDMYGRLLSDVTLDGKNINLEQVRRGFAWFYRFYAKELRTEDVKAYDQAEAQARKEKRGLWADASPVPPWEFRQSGKTTNTQRRPAKLSDGARRADLAVLSPQRTRFLDAYVPAGRRMGNRSS